MDTDEGCISFARRRTWLTCLMIGGLLLLAKPVTFASDEVAKPVEEKKSDEATDEKKTEEKKSAESKSAEPSIVDQLSGGAKEKSDSGAEKMDRAVKGMRNAGQNLDDGLTTDVTQNIQKQVIRDLDDIINQLENPPPNPNGGGGGGGGGASGGGSGNRGGGSSSQSRGNRGGLGARMRRPQSSSGQRGTTSSQNQQEQSEQEALAGGEKSREAQDSSKQTLEERKAAQEAARRQKLEMDVWGHLPPHLREELLNTYGDRMLPKYEQMVKQFYEALSVQGDKKK